MKGVRLLRVVLGSVFSLLFIVFLLLFFMFFDTNSKLRELLKDIRKYSYSNIFNGKGKCIKEGWTADSIYGESTPCCPGLQMVGLITQWDPNMHLCSLNLTPIRICLKCGDGICGYNENYCNCRNDCPLTTDDGGYKTPNDGWE